MWNERILEDVSCGIGRRQRHRDHEVSRGKAEEDEHDGLAAQSWEPLFETGDAALPVRAQSRAAAVNRQRAAEGDQHQNRGCEWREEAGREERDARLVAKSREVDD